MTYLDLARASITRHEGLRLTVYDDATGEPIVRGTLVQGHPTIGFGRACDVKGISRTEAEDMLSHDLVDAERIARAFAGDCWSSLNDARKAVLLDCAHQLGRQFLDWPHTQAALIRAVGSGDWQSVADAMLDSKVARRQAPERWRELAAVMITGETEPA